MQQHHQCQVVMMSNGILVHITHCLVFTHPTYTVMKYQRNSGKYLLQADYTLGGKFITLGQVFFELIAMSSFAQAGNEQLYNQILGLLPANHDEALEITLRLVRYVYHQKARASETQYERMMHLNTQKNEDRMRRLLEENAVLVRERDDLLSKTQSMNSELTKLDAVRKNLGIAVNHQSPSSTRTGAPNFAASQTSVGSPNYANHSVHPYSSPSGLANGATKINGGVSLNNTLRFKDLSLQAPATTPGKLASPLSRHSDVISAIDSSVQQNINSGGIHSSLNAGNSRISYGISSPVASATKSPLPKNSPSLVTGKAFFRECRLQLKPPVFDAFLEVVKQLNRNEISREQAVEKSKEVLGADNMELVGSFRTLLFG